MKYVLGIIFIGVGFLMVWKSQWFVENFGNIEFAESKFSTSGGTSFFYKLIGIAAIVLSFLFMTGSLGAIILKIFKPTAL